MRIILLLAIFAIAGACGRVDHNIKASGTATVRHEIDVQICDDLPKAERIECIRAVVEILNKAVQPENVTSSY